MYYFFSCLLAFNVQRCLVYILKQNIVPNFFRRKKIKTKKAFTTNFEKHLRDLFKLSDSFKSLEKLKITTAKISEICDYTHLYSTGFSELLLKKKQY